MSNKADSIRILYRLGEYETLMNMAIKIAEQRDIANKAVTSLHGRKFTTSIKEKETMLSKLHNRIMAEVQWLDDIINYLVPGCLRKPPCGASHSPVA